MPLRPVEGTALLGLLFTYIRQMALVKDVMSRIQWQTHKARRALDQWRLPCLRSVEDGGRGKIYASLLRGDDDDLV